MMVHKKKIESINSKNRFASLKENYVANSTDMQRRNINTLNSSIFAKTEHEVMVNYKNKVLLRKLVEISKGKYVSVLLQLCLPAEA